ncbi:MAG: imidazolonepropionase [Azospirillum sp.]|nr:imidazolonepropionase [Azospirillum sp.]MCA3267676.1 imidazolonepropionase [Azospirillum sp.]MCZ8125109.1 imidazolonepropionase [Magnetospirillum sp.]
MAILYENANLATFAGAGYGVVEDGAMLVADGRLVWVGPRADAPEAASREDLGGGWVLPGFVDCHTHLVFGGDRADEFEKRLEGASYEEIARAGGGIKSTVAKTRAASFEDLFDSAARRLHFMADRGVTTVEIKSGYGLDAENELKQLAVARALGERLGVRVRTTFLGLHAVPPEFADRQAEYAAHVAAMIPAVARSGLADAVDAFADSIGFTNAETRLVFDAARAHGLPVKLHAEQLTNQRGAALAASYGAMSADHLEHLDADGIAAMAASGTVAVLLPAAFYFLRDTKLPPVAALRAAGVRMALASDCNPGSAPALDPRLVLNMGCTLFRLTPAEALAGYTREGANALGLGETCGTLEAGKAADFCVWDIERPADLVYWIGGPGPRRIFRNGEE